MMVCGVMVCGVWRCGRKKTEPPTIVFVEKNTMRIPATKRDKIHVSATENATKNIETTSLEEDKIRDVNDPEEKGPFIN